MTLTFKTVVWEADKSAEKEVSCVGCGERFIPSARALAIFGKDKPKEGWKCHSCQGKQRWKTNKPYFIKQPRRSVDVS